MAEALDEAAQEAQMNALMRAPMPRIYANGFALAQSASDVTVVMLHNNNPAAMLSMSYISAKSLLVDLGKLLEGLEAVLKQPILTINEISEEMTKTKGKPSA